MGKSFTLRKGAAPLLISIPHMGTVLPSELAGNYNENGALIADTDWHLDRLYDFAVDLDATILCANVSRYVVDLNRPPTDESLYPGQTTTGLFPDFDFRGQPIFRDGGYPDEGHKEKLRVEFWQPYHDALLGELIRLRSSHPNVLLWEAHSIASKLPRLFDGQLPDLNIGTQSGKTVAPEVQKAVVNAAARSSYSYVDNGRFKGGYITRHYADPSRGVHAVQLELSQLTYMNEAPPFEYRDDIAKDVARVIQSMVVAAMSVVTALK